MNPNKKIIYLDYAAATPLDMRVKKAMQPFLNLAYGNPSSLHKKGVEARLAVDSARKTIADIIGGRAEEIVFTSSGTEACNLAILGMAAAYTAPPRSKHRAKHRGAPPWQERRKHIVTTVIEHHAVLEPIKQLARQGWNVAYLRVDRQGFISIDDLKKAIRPETLLVSVIYANNEIGTIEPIAEIGHLLSRVNVERQKNQQPSILFHTDACQAAGSLDLNVNRLQVDLISVSASKIYGPKGAGFLYVRRGVPIAPIVFGGGQERGVRSGTENVAGIVGMATALRLATTRQQAENKRLLSLQDYLFSKIKKSLPKIILNGPQINGPQILKKPTSSKLDDRQVLRISDKYNSKYKKYKRSKYKRLPNNINLTVPGVEGEALMLYLDAYGICVSTGSACTTGSTDASHVLKALGRTETEAKESIRITLGKDIKKADLDYFLRALKYSISLLRDQKTF